MLFLKVQMEKIHPTLYTSVAPRAEGIEISSFSFILTDFRYTITQGYRAFSVSAQGLTPVLSSLLVYFYGGAHFLIRLEDRTYYHACFTKGLLH